MPHNRRKNRLDDAFEPELREEMLAAFWDATDTADLEAWFAEPWRDGRNAVRLCLLAVPASRIVDPSPEATLARAWILDVLVKDHAQLSSDEYARAEEFKYEVSRTDGTRYGILLDAALAIYANWIARSDGGGHVPNVHLARAFGQVLYAGELEERIVHEDVGLWRSVDAGIDWRRIGDGSDPGKRAAAHRWFWMNRRYHMANVLAKAV